MVDFKKNRISQVLNNVSSGIIIVSLDNSIKFINKIGKRILHIEKNVINSKIDELFKNRILNISIRKTLEFKKSLARVVTKIELGNNKSIIIGFTTSLYYDEKNILTGVLISFRDITEKYILESRLKFSEKKYKLLIQNLMCPIFIISYNNFEIQESNITAEKKLAFNKNEFKNLSFLNLIAEKYREITEYYLNEIKCGRLLNKSIEIQLLNRFKKFMIFDTIANLLELENDKYIQVICFEITDKVILTNNLADSYMKLKETQDLMIRAERLAAVGELAAGISHEIKNRFQVISNGISYIKSNVDMTNEGFKVNINHIENEILRGVELLNELMDFARPHPPSKSLVDINDIVRDSKNLVKKLLDDKKIQFIEELSELPKIYADYNLIQQVVVNLLNNAEYAMKKTGILKVKTYMKSFEDAPRKFKLNLHSVYEKYIVIEISDTGTGIEEENISKIFTPFFSTKGSKEGKGLGLSVSNTIIEKHKGFIDLTSKYGEGTIFYIYLPIIMQEE